MNEIPKMQVEGDELEPRKTGNTQLDRLLNEAAAMPLAISSEEMFHLIPKSSPTSSNRLGNFNWIITGAILLTGLVLYTLLSKRNINPLKENSISNNHLAIEPTIKSEAAKEASEKNITASTKDNNSSNLSIQKKSSKEAKETASNKNSIYLEGTKTVLLTHENKIISIELNRFGVKKIIDDGVLVSVDNYSNYNQDIEQASIRSGIKFKLEEKKHLSKKEELAEAIIQGLYKENLLVEGQSYDLNISNEEAILNGKVLSSENRKKMLEIIEQTTGKKLPSDGKIHIRH